MNRNFNNFIKLKYSKYVARIENYLIMLSAKAFRNKGSILIKPLISLARLNGNKINKSTIKVIVKYLRDCSRLVENSNLKSLVIYLKVSSIILQKRLGGDYLKDLTPLGCRIKHSKGIPSLIPRMHRKRIAAGDLNIIRLWLTLFAIYRVIEVRPKISLDSITKPGKDFVIQVDFIEFFWNNILKEFGKNFWPSFSLVWKPFSLHKSSPCAISTQIGESWEKDKKTKKFSWRPNYKAMATSLPSMVSTIVAWRAHPDLLKILKSWMALSSSTWNYSRLEYWISAFWSGSSPYSEFCYLTNGIWIYSNNFLLKVAEQKAILGKLGYKLEAAGKLRVFAMVDPITQWVLKPLHDWIFSVLKLIPMDGTHDQLKPINRLYRENKFKGLYSFDLSSATDRLPVSIQELLLIPLLGVEGAELWRKLLVDRFYYHPVKYWKHGSLQTVMVCCKPLLKKVKYQVGQPMGALSSWALLAITHHFLIQYSAYRAGIISRSNPWLFTCYAILGDDVVIGNRKVALFYRRLCRQIGLGISLPKSISSHKGTALEFAKQTFYKGNNVTPITLKGFIMARNNVASMFDFMPTHLEVKDLLLIYGYGYKAISKINFSFDKLNAHSRMRDRMFTYLILKDTSQGIPLSRAMGRVSLRSYDENIISDYERGFFFYEGLSQFFIKPHKSLIGLLKKIKSKCDVLIEYNWQFPETLMRLGGLSPLTDLNDKNCKTRVIKETNSWLTKELIVNRSDAEVHNLAPFLLETEDHVAKLKSIYQKVTVLSNDLHFRKKSNYLERIMELETEYSLVPSESYNTPKDALLNSEWGRLIKAFHNRYKSSKVSNKR